MIVSFMLFPYFPNTSRTPPMPMPTEPAPESPADISPAEVDAFREQVARAEAELTAARSREQELAQALQKAAEQARPTDPQPTVDISPAELAALQERMAQTEAALDAARARERRLARALHEATFAVQRLPPLDLVIALDTTTSMRSEVASLREAIAQLAELLVQDRCDLLTALRVEPLRRLDGPSVHQLTAVAQSMRPGSSRCNRSESEDYAEALRAAVAANWRPVSERRSIVIVSDTPAHDDMRRQAIADAGQFARCPGARHAVSSMLVDTTTVGPASSRGRVLHAADCRSWGRPVCALGRERLVVGDDLEGRL